jgi:hypothetical protein
MLKIIVDVCTALCTRVGCGLATTCSFIVLSMFFFLEIKITFFIRKLLLGVLFTFDVVIIHFTKRTLIIIIEKEKKFVRRGKLNEKDYVIVISRFVYFISMSTNKI